jgi:stachyose synthetase
MGKAEEYVVYLNEAEEILLVTPKADAIQVTIQPSSFEIFSFVPVEKLDLDPTIKFAPIGLTNMFYNGGAIQELEYIKSGAENKSVKIKVKGHGNFLAYSRASPKECYLNGAEVAFEWLASGKLTLNLPWVEEAGGISDVAFVF